MLLPEDVTALDLETTGFSKDQHEIIDVGFWHANGGWGTRIRPEHIETAQADALRVNGYSQQEWSSAPFLVEVVEPIHLLLSGRVVVGFNIYKFDQPFLCAKLSPFGLASDLFDRVIDVWALAKTKLPGRPRYKLADVCQYLSIPPEDDVHRAIAGAQKAFECYQKLRLM